VVFVRETTTTREGAAVKRIGTSNFVHTDITGANEAREVAQELCDRYGYSAQEAVATVEVARARAIGEGNAYNAATYVGSAIYRRNYAGQQAA
jgi:hypothetical protein